MKKYFIAVWLIVTISGYNQLLGQNSAAPQYNYLKIKAIGFSALWGMEKYFEPLTLTYFEQNSRFAAPALFRHPPGAFDNPRRNEDDTPPLGISLQVAWPIGKKQNELRTGFGFQQHNNFARTNSNYFQTPDVYRMHEIRFSDEYIMAQLTYDFVFHTKSLLQVARLMGGVGGTCGISTRHSLNRLETIIEFDSAGLRPNRFGGFFGTPRNTIINETYIGTSPRLETGIRATGGVEFQLNRLGIPIGLGGFWGYGLVYQTVFNGGNSRYKWTEFAQVQARYFL